MFEQLAGKVLWNVLSKYFTDESLSKNNVSKSTQLGIWSGYVELQNLEVKQEIINSKLRGKGHPIELVHCVVRRVEITIPFAKLSSSSTRNSNINKNNGGSDLDDNDNSFAAILVLDGVHMLFRTSFEFHDDDLQAEEVRNRREALKRSERFAISGKVDAYEDEESDIDGDPIGNDSTNSKSYAAMLKERITSGLVQRIIDKLHVHVRDLHVRMEDAQPSDPWAFGLTLESMHILHDADQERSSVSGVVSKVAQINHFAAYWNPLEPFNSTSDDVPIENSVLHLALRNRPAAISQSLDKCIARRGSMLSVPSRHDYIPIHSYILLPLDGTMNFYLSLTPKDLRIRPALEIVVNVDVVSTQLRDFQCVQMLRLYGQQKNFKFMQRYRKYRPRQSIMMGAKAWWLYAAKVVKYQLEKSNLRWSWTRFRQVYASRLRYMELYERRIKSIGVNGDAFTNGQTFDDEIMNESVSNQISSAEQDELQRLEDGVEGGLSVSDIVLFRALVNMRLERTPTVSSDRRKVEPRITWYRRAVGDLATEDRNTREEFDRLIQYLENPPTDRPFSESRNELLTFFSMEMKLAEVRTALFAPLHSTIDQPQRRRLQEKFFETHVSSTAIAGSIKGDYNRWDVEFAVEDFEAFEIRLDRSKHPIANRMKLEQDCLRGGFEQEGQNPLFMFSFTKKPTEKPDIVKELSLLLSPVEWKLDLDCQWITRGKEFLTFISTIPNVSKFWNELSLAHLNSLALGRLGVMAKAEAAATNHENILVDIHLYCPVIRIGVGEGCDLILDFGLLMLQTDKLAGVSRNKINQVHLLQDDVGEKTTTTASGDNIDSNSLGASSSSLTTATRTPTHTIRASLQKLIFSSGGTSVGSFWRENDGNGSVAGGSFFFDDDFSRAETRVESKNFEDMTSETLFYDTYKLRLQTGKFVFSGESEVFEICQGMEINSAIQKSIIPSDHTICKTKANVVVGSINFVMNEEILSRLALAASLWRMVVRTDVGSQNFQFSDHTVLDLRGGLDLRHSMLSDTFSHHPFDGETSGSEVDEENFFDAKEGSESLGGENPGIWFEDNWIADVESVIDGDSCRPSGGGRLGRRRQPSISDVSSTSDQSRSRRNQHDKGYLSAENLARLEENVGEDDSVADSRLENDDDSFHSVLTKNGQLKLVEDLEMNIKQSEEQIDTLRSAIRELSFSKDIMAESELRKRRQRRKGMKGDISRAEAELRAMQVLLADLRLLLSDEYTNDNPSTKSAQRIQHANDAKALLKARRQRFSSDADAYSHNLTRCLNRQNFKCFVVFNDVKLTVQVTGKNTSLGCIPETDFDLNVRQIASALVLHENDTRLYFSIDQAVVCLGTHREGENNKSCVLFSGGSSDTLLPVHLPHLIAQSMEDRFIRVALRLRKSGSSVSSHDAFRIVKLRLVVGDVEVSPYQKCVAPLASIMDNFYNAMKNENSYVEVSSDDDQAVIQESSPAKDQKMRSYDLAVRFPSIRVLLSRDNEIVGASTVTEVSIRVLTKSSLTKNASHIDFRCSNVQLLDIDNLEGGRGFEVFGRRDPYSHLVQLTFRHQVLPHDDEGRWLLGVDRRPSELDIVLSTKSAHKIYVSGRINPLSIIASSGTAEKLIGSVEDLKQNLLFLKSKTVENKIRADLQRSTGSESLSRPLQWRADVSIRRVHVVFQENREEEKKDWTTEDAVNKLSMAFTLTVSASDVSRCSHNCFSIQTGVTDISLLRYIDDWPILEPWSCLIRISSGKTGGDGEDDTTHSIQPLRVSGAEIDSVVKRFGWDPTFCTRSGEDGTSVSFKLSPLKINISAPTVQLLSETVQSFKSLPIRIEGSNKKQRKEMLDPFLSATENSRDKRPVSLQIHMAQVEIQLLREEAGTRPISHANALLLFCLSDTRIDFSQGSSVTGSVLIRKSDLFDLSSGRGIRVIGEEPGAKLDVPYFVQVKAYKEHHPDGPQTARVIINWGCIQFLALPSFVQSILDLKNSLSSIVVRHPKWSSDSSSVKKDELLTRLMSLPNDVNVMLRAQCETFDFILPSQEVTELVKEGDTDRIGVVSFRWKASLSVAFALDCLQPGSIPWLTLNQDGNIADDDGSLLKGFCHRHLDTGNPGLKNIFTIRSSLDVCQFQALRTNIVQIELAQALKYGYNPLPRVCFRVSQPLAGEQRITNPIDFNLNYHSAGAATKAGQVEMSQSVSFDAKFVDVLLYIQSGSSGGFTDAIRVTVKPILEKLQKKDKLRTLERSANSNFNRDILSEPRGLVDIMKQSPTVISLQIDGLQVTCVPGGASRLNESPFFKCELSQLAAGVACAPLTQHRHSVKTLSTANVQDLSPRHNMAGTEAKSLFLGAWIRCVLSGHYHNRRLVAWEPFLEPWTLMAQFGVDLSDLVSWLPLIMRQEIELTRPTQTDQTVSTQVVKKEPLAQNGQENAKIDRFRDLGRLLRSPFQTSQAPSGVKTEKSTFIAASDFCYLLLASMASNTFSKALFMSSAGKAGVFSVLPTQDGMGWFKTFGMPQQQGNVESDEPVSASLLLSDSRPLNINFSGAFFENVSGAFDSAKSGTASRVVPHLIQNISGMSVRFQEVLDSDRVTRGEEATKIRLGNGSVIPLTLKRSLSQTCDPHRAYIHLELGSFEDMVGRVSHKSFELTNGGSKSSCFFFKAAAKIPVDAVGAHRFALDRNLEVHPDSSHNSSSSRDVSWIIVRVKLQGSVKVVSIESPLMLKSAADAELVCEVRKQDGLSLLWRCIIPKDGERGICAVPVPADLVPFLHDGPYQLTVAALSRRYSTHKASSQSESISVRPAARTVAIPPPFSKEKGMIKRGVVGEDEVILKTVNPPCSATDPETEMSDFYNDDDGSVYLSACGIRIGKASFSRVRAGVQIPEQRMLFFRSPLIIKNFLALPIALQIRVKETSGSSSFYGARETTKGGQSLSRSTTTVSDWEDIGVLDCGQAQNWTGSLSSDQVQIRVRIVGADGDNSRIFPEWSTPTDIPPGNTTISRGTPSAAVPFAKMKLADADGVPLFLSVALETGDNDWRDSEESVIEFCESFPSATRVVAIFVPYWIIDSTQEDLEYFAGSPISGQLKSTVFKSRDGWRSEHGHTLGLAELMENGRTFLYSKSMPEFNVLMIGDENSSRLTVRKRHNRRAAVGSNRYMPWSEPIPLQGRQNQHHELTVFDPEESSFDETDNERNSQNLAGRLVLRAIIVGAPTRFGGHHGTKVLHVVNRYVVSNETGRDIEIAPQHFRNGDRSFLTVTAGFSKKEPLHMDDAQPIRFRFKEYGWTWSGLFKIRSNQREVTMQVRHKMKPLTMIVTVERVSKNTGTSILIFRKTRSPPFRLENHTMYPLLFGQLTSRMTSEESRVDSLLQYQIADYAWDEPEIRSRVLIVKSSASTDGFLGRFKLDSLVPGTEFELNDSMFSAEVVGDGPTRVLRITETGLPRISSFRQDDFDNFHKPHHVSKPISIVVSIKLSHGIGISLIDFSPRELVYIRLQDLHVEQKVNKRTEDVRISIAHIKVNNQLWVTPYPVLMRMGKQGDNLYYRARRGRDAVSISWRRSLNAHGGYGHLTLLDNVDVSMEPAYVNVDGELAGYIFRMIKHVTEVGSVVEDVSSSTRDDALKALLALNDGTTSHPPKSFAIEDDQYLDFLSTAGVAAKLKYIQPYHHSLSTPRHRFNPGRYSSRRQKNQPPSEDKHKFHVERARISTAKVDISWSGPLPGMMSSLLFKALTFERLPIRLRPFSSTHTYGTFEDHLEILKSHYVSYGRVVDLLMGLSSNPTFLFRAVLYTLRESCVAVLDTVSTVLGTSSVQLSERAWHPKGSDLLQPTFDDGSNEYSIENVVVESSSNIVRRVTSPFFRLSSLLLLNMSSVVDWFACKLKFGSRNTSSKQARGQVRSRNPRLFAHLDGFDMLVDFVEGENAGKALLSRVRMGIHLGEGYFCHVEGARQARPHAKSRADLDPTPFILMVTSERILLLNGKLDSDFCSVVWEVFFLNTAYVELIPASELSTFSYDEIILWHMCDPVFAHDRSFDDGRNAGHNAGLEVMRPSRIFIPRQTGRQVMSRIHSIDHRL